MPRLTIYTLIIDDYAPEITQMTLPLMKRYAKKIGAEFHIITERKFPHLPIPMEKLQIYELAKERDDDWSWFLDADTLVHPDFFDPTNHIPPDSVAHYGLDMAGHRWRYDEYFRRDGRHIGSCNWCAIAPRDCIDLWKPLDIPLEEAVANIFPVHVELATGIIEPSHLIDDYTLSRNIAKYGLKCKTLLDIMEACGTGKHYLWHVYNMPNEAKARIMYELLSNPVLLPGQKPQEGVTYGWGLMEKIKSVDSQKVSE